MYTIIYSYLKIMYPGYLGRYTAVQNVLPTVYCTNIRKSWIPYCPYQNVHKMYLFFWASFIRWDQNGAMWNIDGQFNHPADQIVEKLRFNCYFAGCLTLGANGLSGRSGSTALRESLPSSSASPSLATTSSSLKMKRWIGELCQDVWKVF